MEKNEKDKMEEQEKEEETRGEGLCLGQKRGEGATLKSKFRQCEKEKCNNTSAQSGDTLSLLLFQHNLSGHLGARRRKGFSPKLGARQRKGFSPELPRTTWS